MSSDSDLTQDSDIVIPTKKRVVKPKRKKRLTPQQKQTAEFRRLAMETPPGEVYITPYRKWALEPNQKLGMGQVDGWCETCQHWWPANTFHWRLDRKTGTFGDMCLLCKRAKKHAKKAEVLNGS